MATPGHDPLDLIGIVIAIITYLGAKEVAETISPYIAIVITATMAAGWALSKSGEMTIIRSLKFMCLRIGTAVIFAVTLAQLIHGITSWANVRYTVIPIAFLIGLIKDLDELKEYKNNIFKWFKSRGKDVS